MANVILDQFAPLKQPACDYLSQVYEISHHLQDLKEALVELLFVIQPIVKSGHKLLERNEIPFCDLEALHLCQSQAIGILRQVVNNLESYRGFENYSAALAQVEVAHG